MEPISQYQRPTPTRPSAATDSPITAPPKNATLSALPWPCSDAAADVRTFARVAAFIPKKPASTELRAPVMYASDVYVPMASQSRIATSATNAASTEYSRRRNAMAPAWICSERSRIRSVPTDCPRT